MWRIKTLEELKEIGTPNWTFSMNYLAGLPLTDKIVLKIKEDGSVSQEWFPEKTKGCCNWQLQLRHIIEDSKVKYALDYDKDSVMDYTFRESELKRDFQVGDLVTSIFGPTGFIKRKTIFRIVNIRSKNLITIFSDQLKNGWNGKDHNYDVSTNFGCWNVSKTDLTLVSPSPTQQTKNEVPRQNLQGKSGGNSITIHYRKSPITGGSRPHGSQIANFKFKKGIRQGSLKYNKIQSN